MLLLQIKNVLQCQKHTFPLPVQENKFGLGVTLKVKMGPECISRFSTPHQGGGSLRSPAIRAPRKTIPTGLCGNAWAFRSFRSGNNQRISEVLVIFVMGKPIRNSYILCLTLYQQRRSKHDITPSILNFQQETMSHFRKGSTPVLSRHCYNSTFILQTYIYIYVCVYVCVYIYIYASILVTTAPKHHCVCAQSFGCVRLFSTPGTIAHQTPLSMRLSRQEYWSGQPLPTPRDLPDPGIETVSSASAGRFFTAEPPGKPKTSVNSPKKILC